MEVKLPGRPAKADDMKMERAAGEALESSLQETANVLQVQGPASEAVKRVCKHVRDTSWHALFMASALLLEYHELPDFPAHPEEFCQGFGSSALPAAVDQTPSVASKRAFLGNLRLPTFLPDSKDQPGPPKGSKFYFQGIRKDSGRVTGSAQRGNTQIRRGGALGAGCLRLLVARCPPKACVPWAVRLPIHCRRPLCFCCLGP